MSRHPGSVSPTEQSEFGRAQGEPSGLDMARQRGGFEPQFFQERPRLDGSSSCLPLTSPTCGMASQQPLCLLRAWKVLSSLIAGILDTGHPTWRAHNASTCGLHLQEPPAVVRTKGTNGSALHATSPSTKDSLLCVVACVRCGFSPSIHFSQRNVFVIILCQLFYFHWMFL